MADAATPDYADIDWANVAPDFTFTPWWTVKPSPDISASGLPKSAMMVLAGGAALALLIALLPTGSR